MTFEVWKLLTDPRGPQTIEAAPRLESAGWDGVVIPDSQNIDGGDPLVSAALALHVSQALKVAIGVANPVTRHPASLANSLCALDEIARGRVRLGVGRGDSALAHLGQAPARSADFETYVRIVRRYVAGDEIEFDDLLPFQLPSARPLAEAGLNGVPSSSRLHWPEPGHATPAVDIAASGPRTITFGARHADGVMLSVGADPERLRWAVNLAKANGASRIVAFINLVAHPDPLLARDLARRHVAPFARFSVMDGQIRGDVTDAGRAELERLHGAYDMADHGERLSSSLDDAFVDSFAVVGTAERCLQRLEELAALGLDGIIVVGANPAQDPPEVKRAEATFESEVLPALESVPSPLHG